MEYYVQYFHYEFGASTLLKDVKKRVMDKIDPNDDERLEFNEFQTVIGPVMAPRQDTYRPV